MDINNRQKFESEQQSIRDKGTNISFSNDIQGVHSQQSAESPTFNKEKLKLISNSSNQNNLQNESNQIIESPINQLKNNSKHINEGDNVQQLGIQKEILSSHNNILNQNQQENDIIQNYQYEQTYDKNHQLEQQKSQNSKIEQERKYDYQTKSQMIDKDSRQSSNNAIQFSNQKQNQSGVQNHSSHFQEDVGNIENYNSSNKYKNLHIKESNNIFTKNNTDRLNYQQNQQNQISSSSLQQPTYHVKFNEQQNLQHEKEKQQFIEKISDIITDKETINFLINHYNMNGINAEGQIYFVHFLEELKNEFSTFLQFNEGIDTIQFEEVLSNNLTTTNTDYVSLNALQILTKDVGLSEKIQKIAQTIISDSKQREKECINKKIFEEVNQLSRILEQKSNYLSKKEKDLISKERILKQQEQDYKNILKGEFDIMIFSLDEAIKERNMEVNKKSIQLERNLKNKMKIIETKAKELKQIQSNSSSNADKLKSKLASQEKQGDFLKLKTQDLEKRLVNEQENNIILQQKYDNLLRKNKELEKYIKEIQGNIQSFPIQEQNRIQDKKIEFSQSEARQILYLIQSIWKKNKFMNEIQKINEIFLSKIPHQFQNNLKNLQLFQYFQIIRKFINQNRIENQFVQSEGINIRNLSQVNYDQHSPVKIDSIEEDELKLQEMAINQSKQDSNNDGSLSQWNIPTFMKQSSSFSEKIKSEIEQKIETDNILSAPATKTLKKKTPLGQMGVNTSTDEEVKVLLNIISTLMNNIKTILPLVVKISGKEMNDYLQHSSENLQDMSLAVTKNSTFDVGEFLYPCFNNLVGSLVEIVPSLLLKQCNSKHLYSIISIMFKAISFKFRYLQNAKQIKKNMLNTILSDNILQSTCNIIKSQQDHINEIMMNPKKPTELTFIPQTTFWKRKIKLIPKKKTVGEKNSAALSRLSQQHSQIGFQLFQNENIQKEILQVFKQYLDQTELQLKRKEQAQNLAQEKQIANLDQNNQDKNVMIFDFTENKNSKNDTQNKSTLFENQKYILMTRINLQLMTLLLQVTNKESINALQLILLDISNENESLNNFLRNYIVNLGFIEILIWRMLQSKDESNLIELSVDLMLNMSQNGSHYKQFIQDISEDNIISKLITIFDKYSNYHDICEKLSVIIQRISYHNDNLKVRLLPKQIAIIKKKLAQAEQSKEDNEFLISNLNSILSNLS